MVYTTTMGTRVKEMSNIQIHTLKDGSTVEIERKNSGRGHRYIVDGGKPLSSVTGILGHLDSDSFSIGMNWALKQARLADGDLDAPKRIGNAAREAGELLHKQVEEFIRHGTIAEDGAFLAWHRLMDGLYRSDGVVLVATERFVYDPELMLGGTIDCIATTHSMLAPGDVFDIYDWKTKEPDSSYDKYGPSPRDFAQVAGYVHALRAMNSEWTPRKAYIVYVMRDGSRAERVEVPLDQYIPIYKAAHTVSRLLQGVK